MRSSRATAPSAIGQGPELRSTWPVAADISQALSRRASSHPRQLALAIPKARGYQEVDFAQLEAEVQAVAAGLAALGLAPGTKVALMVPPSLPFFALTFALFRAGMIPVFIDPGIGLQRVRTCLAQAGPTVFIGTAPAQIARVLGGWRGGGFSRCIQVGPGAFCLGATPYHAVQQAGRRPGLGPFVRQGGVDALAAIVFTSGSTGAPKGVAYSHANFSAQIQSLRQLLRFVPGEVDLCTFPLFALFAPALGMSAVLPQLDFSRPARAKAERIFAAIRDYQVRTMFASPALLHNLAQAGAQNGTYLPSLRRVVSAGAAVHSDILKRTRRLLSPEAEIFTPYGATEALPVSCIGSREILSATALASGRGHGICVGRPAPGIRLAIIPISDLPIAHWDASQTLPTSGLDHGAIGEIIVQGPQVTAAYYENAAADTFAKIPGSAPGAAGWHRMGDIGRLDDAGRLWFYGRKSQRVRTRSGDLYTEASEAVFNTHPRVYRSALIGRGPAGAEEPVLVVEARVPLDRASAASLRHELGALAKQHASTSQIGHFHVQRALPVDRRHNAKIQREQLRAALAAGPRLAAFWRQEAAWSR